MSGPGIKFLSLGLVLKITATLKKLLLYILIIAEGSYTYSKINLQTKDKTIHFFMKAYNNSSIIVVFLISINFAEIIFCIWQIILGHGR